MLVGEAGTRLRDPLQHGEAGKWYDAAGTRLRDPLQHLEAGRWYDAVPLSYYVTLPCIK